MKHLVASLFHVMMTDRVDVRVFYGGGAVGLLWKKKCIRCSFFPSSPKNQKRMIAGWKISSFLL